MSQITRSNAEVLVPKELVPGLFEGIRRQSKILSLFKKLPNMTTDKTELRVLDALPIAYFQDSDTAMKKTTSLAWKNKVIYAAEIAVIVPISESLLADADYDIFGSVRPLLEENAAKLIDSAIITGVGKPRQWREGLIYSINQAGAVITPTADQTFYSQINDAMEKVESSGYNVTALLGGTDLKAKFRMMVDSTGQPLNTTEIGSITREFVNNGAWDKNEASLIVGDFSQGVYAIRQDVTYKILDQAVIQDLTTGKIVYNLAQQDMVALRMTMRLGWEIPNPVNIENETTSRFPFAMIKGDSTLTTINTTIKVTSDGTTAISGANVTLGGNDAITGSDGTAVFKTQKNQEYVLRVAKDGYKTYYDTVETAAATATTTITLKVNKDSSLGKNPADK